MSDCAEPLLSGKWGGRLGGEEVKVPQTESGATDGEKEADQQHLTEKDHVCPAVFAYCFFCLFVTFSRITY